MLSVRQRVPFMCSSVPELPRGSSGTMVCTSLERGPGARGRAGSAAFPDPLKTPFHRAFIHSLYLQGLHDHWFGARAAMSWPTCPQHACKGRQSGGRRRFARVPLHAGASCHESNWNDAITAPIMVSVLSTRPADPLAAPSSTCSGIKCSSRGCSLDWPWPWADGHDWPFCRRAPWLPLALRERLGGVGEHFLDPGIELLAGPVCRRARQRDSQLPAAAAAAYPSEPPPKKPPVL